jgi:hypothetical protein
MVKYSKCHAHWSCSDESSLLTINYFKTTMSITQKNYIINPAWFSRINHQERDWLSQLFQNQNLIWEFVLADSSKDHRFGKNKWTKEIKRKLFQSSLNELIFIFCKSQFSPIWWSDSFFLNSLRSIIQSHWPQIKFSLFWWKLWVKKKNFWFGKQICDMRSRYFWNIIFRVLWFPEEVQLLKLYIQFLQKNHLMMEIMSQFD